MARGEGLIMHFGSFSSGGFPFDLVGKSVKDRTIPKWFFEYWYSRHFSGALHPQETYSSPSFELVNPCLLQSTITGLECVILRILLSVRYKALYLPFEKINFFVPFFERTIFLLPYVLVGLFNNY